MMPRLSSVTRRPVCAASPAARAAMLAAAFALTAALLEAPALHAQVSANEELDQCMRDAAVSGAMTGGAIGGVLGALLGERTRDRIQKTIGGAAVGAAVGGLAGWHLAYKSCSEKHATASSLVTDEYAACARRLGYRRDRVAVEIDGDALPERVRGGGRLDSDVRYHVLTPDPKDVALHLTRRFLCRDEQGTFNELATPTERITVASGCHVSRGSFPIPSSVPSEQHCRMEVSLSAEGQTRTRASDFRIVP